MLVLPPGNPGTRNWPDTRDGSVVGQPSRAFDYIGQPAIEEKVLIAENAVVRRNPRATYQVLDEGGLVTQLDTGRHHGLNPIGALIWSLSDGRTFAELVEAVKLEIIEPPPELAADMAEFIEALHNRRLVYLSDSAPT